MNVSLTPKLEKLVEQLVAQGRYRSASEVVREGLRLLEIRESQLKPDSRSITGSKKK
ncbi:type II toxin-antitoxin system ParD family antitoxin [Coraliomargarita sinensis]|uniref:Type II toxin-antitoxin system ParD family antitoxin n=1 Tax=Coraliomargarita sinensis TaxID=2174842 RepID=A0A317ZG66_9BACT|nr:type II toxin-antitoxin system ParD family antitoxin [Coraliomargarita sinensis]PXA03882.1 type II toxin-antitoxin system ParD family antitoxin [Coraliomargarita sinensis]